MTEDEKRAAAYLLEVRKRRIAYFSGLTLPQKAFKTDTAKRKTALCSRRAGKTYVLIEDFIETCKATANIKCAYVALTRGSAKQIMWEELIRVNHHLALDLTLNHSELVAIFPNGSRLLVTGADDIRDIEKLRGQAFAKVAIDEAGSFGAHLEPLVDEVLSPALMDQDGTMLLTGTPSVACAGVFYDATTGKRPGWSNHAWTFRDNPHVPQGWIDEEKDRLGITEDSPKFQREYLGRWIAGATERLYQYDPQLNTYDSLPDLPWSYVLGVDLGWVDDCAFVLGAWCPASPTFFILEQYKSPHMLPPDIAATIKRIIHDKPYTKIVADTGGLALTIVEELRARWHIPVIAAKKIEKLANIELMNGDLRRGFVKLRPNAPVLAEWALLNARPDGKEDPTVPNHLSDATLYAYRHAKQFRYEAPVPYKEDLDAVVKRDLERMIATIEAEEPEQEWQALLE